MSAPSRISLLVVSCFAGLAGLAVYLAQPAELEPWEPPAAPTRPVEADPRGARAPVDLAPEGGAGGAQLGGRGPSLRGLTRTHLGASVPRVELRVECLAPGGALLLAAGASDESGEFALATQALSDELLADARRIDVELTARAVGFQPLRERRPLADLLARAEPEGWTWTVVLIAGQALRGRVVDAQGRPVPGAALELSVPSSRAGRALERPAAEALSGADGRFELGYASTSRARVTARAINVGQCLRDGLELTATRSLDLGDLVLQGPGFLAGQLSLADGSPVAGFELWAVPAELGPRDAPARALAQARERETGQGLSWTQVSTDAEGRFRLAGLAPGEYRCLARRAGALLEPAEIVRAVPAEDLRLVLRGARLCVTVLDETGQPRPRVPVSCARWQGEDGGEGPAPARASTDEQGRAYFELESGGSFRLQAGRGAAFAEELVTLGSERAAHEHTLLLASAPTGYLRLFVSGREGATVARWRASLISATTRQRIAAWSDVEPAADGRLGPLPPGRYRAEVVPLGAETEGWLARETGEFDVPTRGSADVELVLERGAALELQLVLAGPPPDGFEFRPAADARPDQITLARRRHALERGARAVLIAPDGRREPLFFEVEPGAPLEATLLPGASARVQGWRTPGPWRLRLEAEGFEPVERELTLAAGERTRVQLELRRR